VKINVFDEEGETGTHALIVKENQTLLNIIKKFPVGVNPEHFGNTSVHNASSKLIFERWL
jgi:hypothetical protein